MILGHRHMTPEDREICFRVPFSMSWADGTDYQSILSKEISKAGLVEVPCCSECGSESIVTDGPCRWDARNRRWENVDIYDSDPYCDHCDGETDIQWRYRKAEAEPFEGKELDAHCPGCHASASRDSIGTVCTSCGRSIIEELKR